MRRHVENQIEKPENDGLGSLIFFAMWALALMLLSTAARGQENPSNQKNQPGTEVTEHIPTSGTDGNQDRLPVPAMEASKPAEPPAAAHQDQPEANEVMLTRFILISIPDRQLALVDAGQVIKIYPIAVGARHTPSPEGIFNIVSHVANPTWSHQGKVVGPGKDNPVGSRWMGLSLKGYGIHGTNVPRSIGKAASHGCFRMGKEDLEELFTLVQVGDTVVVRRQRDELVTQVFGDANQAREVQVASAAVVSADAAEGDKTR
jgi:lipoprotein-anchoring transpeptidase ErfK/SrfK